MGRFQGISSFLTCGESELDFDLTTLRNSFVASLCLRDDLGF